MIEYQTLDPHVRLGELPRVSPCLAWRAPGVIHT